MMPPHHEHPHSVHIYQSNRYAKEAAENCNLKRNINGGRLYLGKIVLYKKVIRTKGEKHLSTSMLKIHRCDAY